MDETSLRDPETKEPVRRASDAELAKIREAIERGRAKRHDGGALPSAIEGAYLSHGGRWVYADVASGIPSFLVAERIELEQPLG
jgi:hypothetical protein